MVKLKGLSRDTLFIALGTVGNKVIVFLLVPFYTYFLTPAAYGQVDLLLLAVQVAVPLATLAYGDALLRFGIGASIKARQAQFSQGLYVIGTMLLLSSLPLLFLTGESFSLYALFVLLLVFQSSNLLIVQQLKANQQLRLYALNGLLFATILLIVSIFFLAYVGWETNGVILAQMIAYFLSSVVMLVAGRFKRFLRFQKPNSVLIKKMCVYALPLIPNSIMWWVMQVSDRFVVSFYLGLGATGLYAVATKIPSILSLVNTVFYQAWQLHALKTKDLQTVTRMFRYYSGFFILVTTVLMAITQPLVSLLFTAPFYDAWQYVPFLLIAVLFSSLASFLEIPYMIHKNTGRLLLTTIYGSVLNIILTLTLIPLMGVNGAGLATLISFMCTFILRACKNNIFTQLPYRPSFFISLVLLMMQAAFLLYSSFGISVQIAMIVAQLLVNRRLLLGFKTSR